MGLLSFVRSFLIYSPLLVAYLIGIGASAFLLTQGQQRAGMPALIGFALLELQLLLRVLISFSPVYFPLSQAARWLVGGTLIANLVAALGICLVAAALIRAVERLET